MGKQSQKALLQKAPICNFVVPIKAVGFPIGKPTAFMETTKLHIETSHLICSANQITDLYIKGNTGLKWDMD